MPSQPVLNRKRSKLFLCALCLEVCVVPAALQRLSCLTLIHCGAVGISNYLNRCTPVASFRICLACRLVKMWMAKPQLLTSMICASSRMAGLLVPVDDGNGPMASSDEMVQLFGTSTHHVISSISSTTRQVQCNLTIFTVIVSLLSIIQAAPKVS